MRGLRGKVKWTGAVILVVNFVTAAIADTLDCSRFRQGPLFKRELFRRDMKQASNKMPCKSFAIYFDYSYEYKPDLFGLSFDGKKSECPNGESFSLNAIDGSIYDDPYHHRSPLDSKELAILLYATSADKGIERNILINSDLAAKKINRGSLMDKLYEIGVDAATNDSLGYHIIDHTWFNYDEIVVESENAYINKNQQLFIKRDFQRHVTDFLLCGREAQMVNPSCTFYFVTNDFNAKARFNKKLLGDLDIIRENALTFTECLTVEK